MTAYEQRSYPGAAADTLLNADITNSATSFSVTPGSGTGYPDGSQGPFFVILDWDNSKAEKIRCSGRVNDTFTVAGTGGGRGQDGTSAQAHTANAKVRAVITATDVQEANRAAANTIGKITTKGDLLAGTGANALARVAVGTDGTPLIADSTQSAGIRYATGATFDANGNLVGPNGVYAGAPRAYYNHFTTTVAGSGGSQNFAATAPGIGQFAEPFSLIVEVSARDVNGYCTSARFPVLVAHEATNAAIVIGSPTGIVTYNGSPGYSWSNSGTAGYVLTGTVNTDGSVVSLTVTNYGAVTIGFRVAVRAASL